MSLEVIPPSREDPDLVRGSTSVLDLTRRLENNARKNALESQRPRNGTCHVSSPRSKANTAPSPRMLVRTGSVPRASGNSSPRAGHEASKEREDRLKAANDELNKTNGVLREENQRLQDELKRLQLSISAEAMADEAPSAKTAPAEESSESRLRAALTKKGVSSSELRQAIRSVDQMLDEAKRELRNAELREQRAAMEALYKAIDKDDELELEVAIESARLAEVSESDIVKGEEKLRELRSMSTEQKAAKQAQKLVNQQKKDAYLLIKKDDPEALKELLDSLDQSVRWKDWRDYAGRTLWKCAMDLRARRQQEFLAPLVGQKLPGDPNTRSGHHTVGVQPSSPESRPNRPSVGDLPRLSIGMGARSSLSSYQEEERPRSRQISHVSIEDDAPLGSALESALESPKASTPLGQLGFDLTREDTAMHDGSISEPPFSPSRILDDDDPATADFKIKALRAVAQDDVYTLEEILSLVHKDVWERWQNKAGKDLLTLSQERGSNAAYSLLARSKGILKELVREVFVDREAVWVFESGEVQPRRATVLEDTPIEEDTVYVEFWDGDEPAVRVDRCMVRKAV